LNLKNTAKKVLVQNLNLKENESFLIVTDDSKQKIAEIFYEASKTIVQNPLLIKMADREKPGEEPPINISDLMRNSNVVLCITEHSLTHTKARINASKNGARIGTMPGITIDMLEKGAITADYNEIEDLTLNYCAILDSGKKVVIKKNNSELTLSIDSRSSIASTGVFKHPGESGNIPSGESYIAPLEDSANGQIIIDGSISGIGVIEEPITLTINSGRLIEATGEDGEKLKNLLGKGNGRKIAELGIGTNKAARLSGNILEDEKVYSTVHIAFGSNQSFGGETNADVHIDCVIKDPKIWIDSDPISIS